MILPDDIHRLMDEYLALAGGAENLRRRELWAPRSVVQDQWHGVPRSGGFHAARSIPITVDLQPAFWLHLFPQDYSACFFDPASYLRFHLQHRIAQFRLLADDTALDGIVPVYLSTPFETSLFGMAPLYYPDKDPLIDQQPVIHSRDDLARLEGVDFANAGMMPQAIRLYEGLRELAAGRLEIRFAEWIRGPLGVALYLRGYSDLLADFKLDPDFAQRLLGLTVSARKDWFRARSRYLGGAPVEPGCLFNDEVDATVIGARHYREHILPHERTLAEFHSGIAYWHSCGNTACFAKDVTGLGHIDLLDISGWTDPEAVLSSLPNPAERIEVRLHPLKDCQQAEPAWMAERVRRVIDSCLRHDVAAVTIRVSGLQVVTSPEQDLAQIRLWIDTARRAINEALAGV